MYERRSRSGKRSSALTPRVRAAHDTADGTRHRIRRALRQAQGAAEQDAPTLARRGGPLRRQGARYVHDDARAGRAIAARGRLERRIPRRLVGTRALATSGQRRRPVRRPALRSTQGLRRRSLRPDGTRGLPRVHQGLAGRRSGLAQADRVHIRLFRLEIVVGRLPGARRAVYRSQPRYLETRQGTFFRVKLEERLGGPVVRHRQRRVPLRRGGGTRPQTRRSAIPRARRAQGLVRGRVGTVAHDRRLQPVGGPDGTVLVHAGEHRPSHPEAREARRARTARELCARRPRA